MLGLIFDLYITEFMADNNSRIQVLGIISFPKLCMGIIKVISFLPANHFLSCQESRLPVTDPDV